MEVHVERLDLRVDLEDVGLEVVVGVVLDGKVAPHLVAVVLKAVEPGQLVLQLDVALVERFAARTDVRSPFLNKY